MDVVARLRYLRISPKKVRLVLELIRGRNVAVAEAQLRHLPKGSSASLLKLLKSAEANAQNNFKLDPASLVVKQAYADEGPKLKRYRPRAFGRAGMLRKRTSHVTIVLAPRGSAQQSSKPVKQDTPTPDNRGLKQVKPEQRATGKNTKK